MLIHILKW